MSKVVAIDLDGCIADYSKGWQGENVFGDVIPGCKEALQKLKSEGNTIIIYTVRQHTKELDQYLESNEIPYDYVNESVPGTYSQDGRKVWANVYIDDRAITFNGNWEKIPRMVRGFISWEKKQKYEEMYQSKMRDNK